MSKNNYLTRNSKTHNIAIQAAATKYFPLLEKLQLKDRFLAIVALWHLFPINSLPKLLIFFS